MKNKVKIIFIILFLILLFFITQSEARYSINKNQIITISSAPCNVNIEIDKTTSTISSQPGNAIFKITITNANSYPITYHVTPASTMFSMEGGITNATLEANTTIDIPVTLSTKENVSYSNNSETATITVDITKPYKKDSTVFNLVIETAINYDLKEMILSNSTIKTATTGMFKNNVTTAADSGVFTMEDECGTSYYFRGVINNNYVSFAGKTWRIMRINGDGSYRLILDATIGQSYFNSASPSTYNNIGYMYGSAANTRGTNSSDIKTFLEDWYTKNLQNYDEYMNKDAIFWNDREIYSTTNGVSHYKGAQRVLTYSPSLKPTVQADMFSVTNTNGKGNALLTKPIGLLTIDEVMLAGGKLDGTTLTEIGTHVANEAYYLNSSDVSFYGFWTLTPRRFQTGNSYNLMFVSKPHAVMYAEAPSTGPRDVKPVINLKNTVRITGAGTKDDPYVVKSAQ